MKPKIQTDKSDECGEYDHADCNKRTGGCFRTNHPALKECRKCLCSKCIWSSDECDLRNRT